MIQPTADQILDVLHKKGYVVFDGGGLDLNLIGIRNDSSKNKFEETFCLLYRKKKGVGPWHLEIHKMTTKPGLPWLLKPFNKDGAAIIKEGQHRGVWSIGKHYGRPALVQSGNFEIFRDNNKNDLAEAEGKTEIWGPEAGLNFHGVWGMAKVFDVGYWSAGCQVLPYDMAGREWAALMDIFTKSVAQYGNKFSYTLLNEKDFL